MNDKTKIKIAENLILEIIHTPEDSNNFYSDQFEGLSLIVNPTDREYNNQGEFKKDKFCNYFEEYPDGYDFIFEKGYTYYIVDCFS